MQTYLVLVGASGAAVASVLWYVAKETSSKAMWMVVMMVAALAAAYGLLALEGPITDAVQGP